MSLKLLWPMISVSAIQEWLGYLLAGQSGCREQTNNPHMAPVSWMMALDRCDWAPCWTESNSHSYCLKEVQVQTFMDKPGPGYGCHMWVGAQGCLERVLQAGTRALTLHRLNKLGSGL